MLAPHSVPPLAVNWSAAPGIKKESRFVLIFSTIIFR